MQQIDMRPFVQTGNTVSISATTSSGSTAISAPRKTNPNLPGTVRVHNAGPDIAYIGQGATAPTVTSSNGIPVPAGNTEVFELLPDTAFVGALCPTSTATVYFTPGQGA